MKDIVRKFRWLHPNEKDAPYFQKDEKGREIYYPWGNTGDGYYLGEGDKTILKRLYYTAVAITMLFGGIFLCALHPVFFINILMFSPIFAGISWFVLLFFYKKKLRAIEQKEMSNKVPRIIREVFTLGTLQVLVILLELKAGLPNPILLQTAFFIIVFYSLFIWFVWHRKGYIFQKTSA